MFVDQHRLLQLGEQALLLLLEPAALGLTLFQATVAVLHAFTQLLGMVVNGLATAAGPSGLIRHGAVAADPGRGGIAEKSGNG